ncbi:hypothetical protein BGW37DRAFT_483495 [Umbelopsis sp. PMI_123]|nr:hypothetical protein BGW37DRAFT_483495 [Umbelopsis sp. PMI_123]
MSAISLITNSNSSHFLHHKHVSGYRVDNDLSRVHTSNKSYSNEIVGLRQKVLSYEMEIQDANREVTVWKRKCSELEVSQQELQSQYENRLQKMKAKFEEDAKRARLVQVAKHDEALNMIAQLRKENESLKEELKNYKVSAEKKAENTCMTVPLQPNDSSKVTLKPFIPNQSAIEEAYQYAVYKSSAYREPTDKLVNKINATVEALEYEIGIMQQSYKETEIDDVSPIRDVKDITEECNQPPPNEITRQKPVLKPTKDVAIVQTSHENAEINESPRLMHSKSAMNLRTSRIPLESRPMSQGQERRYSSASSIDAYMKTDNPDLDIRAAGTNSSPLKTKSANNSPEPSVNKTTPSPKRNLASHWFHRKRKSIADLKMEGIWRNEQVALRPSTSLSTSELALRAESMAAQAMEANMSRESSTASRDNGRRRTVSSVYGFDVTASSASIQQQIRTITPPPSPKSTPVYANAGFKPPSTDQACEDVIPRANIDFETMRHRSSMGGEYIQFQTSLSKSRRGSVTGPKALPQVPASSMSTPYVGAGSSHVEGPLPVPSTSKSRWTKRRVVSAIFKEATD